MPSRAPSELPSIGDEFQVDEGKAARFPLLAQGSAQSFVELTTSLVLGQDPAHDLFVSVLSEPIEEGIDEGFPNAVTLSSRLDVDSVELTVDVWNVAAGASTEEPADSLVDGGDEDSLIASFRGSQPPLPVFVPFIDGQLVEKDVGNGAAIVALPGLHVNGGNGEGIGVLARTNLEWCWLGH